MDKVICKECNETGHFVRDCPNRKCRNCEKPGHAARDCSVSSPQFHLAGFPNFLPFFRLAGVLTWVKEPRNPKNVECRNCLQMGHFSRDCREPRTDTGRVCFNCKSPGTARPTFLPPSSPLVTLFFCFFVFFFFLVPWMLTDDRSLVQGMSSGDYGRGSRSSDSP